MSQYGPDTVHPLIESVAEMEDLVTTLYGGTIAMRDAGELYLPKEVDEENENYENRLERSVLFPAYKQAVKSNTGRLFMQEVEVEGVTAQMREYLSEVDEDENDLTEFAKKVTENAIHHGCTYILVDYPVMNDNSTLEDEINNGGRPYWINIKQTQMLEASPVKRKGKRVLGIFRYKEEIPVRINEFKVKYITQIKQFELVSTDSGDNVVYTVYRKDDSGKWYEYDKGLLIGSGGNPLDEIPIVAVNVEPIGFYVGQPIFYDLAEENKQHWQMTSDYNNIVHISQVPMLQTNGRTSAIGPDGEDASDKITISPNTVLDFVSENGGAKWVEVQGSGAQVGEKAIASSLRRMAVMSLQLMINTEAGVTATASKIDSIDSLSILQSIGKSVEQALIKAIGFTNKYNGKTNENVQVIINLDDAIVLGNANDIDSLIKIYEAGMLTKETSIKELQRRGFVSDNLDVKKEMSSTPTQPLIEDGSQEEEDQQ